MVAHPPVGSPSGEMRRLIATNYRSVIPPANRRRRSTRPTARFMSILARFIVPGVQTAAAAAAATAIQYRARERATAGRSFEFRSLKARRDAFKLRRALAGGCAPLAALLRRRAPLYAAGASCGRPASVAVHRRVVLGPDPDCGHLLSRRESWPRRRRGSDLIFVDMTGVRDAGVQLIGPQERVTGGNGGGLRRATSWYTAAGGSNGCAVGGLVGNRLCGAN